jgi:hypothetical protein
MLSNVCNSQKTVKSIGNQPIMFVRLITIFTPDKCRHNFRTWSVSSQFSHLTSVIVIFTPEQCHRNFHTWSVSSHFSHLISVITIFTAEQCILIVLLITIFHSEQCIIVLCTTVFTPISVSELRLSSWSHRICIFSRCLVQILISVPGTTSMVFANVVNPSRWMFS